MTKLDADELLRPDVLAGVGIVVAGAPGGEFGDAVTQRCASLGASVQWLDVSEFGEEPLADAPARPLPQAGAIQVLINDGASVFAAAGEGLQALRDCLDRCWMAIHAVANEAFLGDGAGGGRIINLAPRPDAGEHAGAARAGLENLARTLSVEWARHAVVTTTVAPGPRTDPTAISQLAAFLASPAGGYYSGCLFTLS